MAEDDDKEDKNLEATEEEIREYAKKLSEGLFNSPDKSDFDERGLASGDAELLDKTDAELFPDEYEEYTEEEKKALRQMPGERDASHNT